VTDSNEQLIISKIDDLHEDVRYLRTRIDSGQEDLTEVKVDVGDLKATKRTVKWVLSFIIPAILALGAKAIAQILS
jgi:hypothetical protein